MPDDILTPQPGTEPTEPVTPQADPQPQAPDNEPQPQEPTPDNQPQADPEPAPAAAAPPVPSLDERYRNSTSEAMILHNQKKGLEDTLKKLTSEDTPTEADLLAEYPDFKQYNAVTQKLMRDTLENKKRQMRLNLKLIEDEAERLLERDLRSVTSQDKYAALRGDDKFRQFVLEPRHKGVDVSVLADAYLVRTGKVQPSDDPAPTPPKPAPASSGLPRGSGGPRTPIKSKKLSLEEAATLRQTNYKEYMRQLKAGNIETEV